MKKIKWKLPHITDTLLGRIFLKKRHQVGICCIIKDENQYLEEWMRYHLQIGVTHFFIYDNESIVSVKDTLARLDLLTYATVIDFPGKSQQVPAYAHCLEHFGFWCRWLAFIDLDEFIVPKESNYHLPTFLENYRQFGGLGVNWLVFGSSGHLHKAEVPQLYRFLMRSDLHFLPNRHIKSIVQPRLVKAAYQPHYFRYKKGRFCVNENGSPIVGYESEVSVDKIQINHYYCRSKEEYREKIDRGRSDIEESRSMDAFYAHDKDANVVEDRTILKVLSGLQVKEN